MQEPDPLLNPCSPFIKARERLTQIATKHVSRECIYHQEIQRLVRQTVEYAFQDASGHFTYKNVLIAKMHLQMLERRLDGDEYGENIHEVLSFYELVTDQSLLELPHVKEFLDQHGACTPIVSRALGEVAIAWYIINEGGQPSVQEMLAPGACD
jgi:hypothetical protein